MPARSTETVARIDRSALDRSAVDRSAVDPSAVAALVRWYETEARDLP